MACDFNSDRPNCLIKREHFFCHFSFIACSDKIYHNFHASLHGKISVSICYTCTYFEFFLTKYNLKIGFWNGVERLFLSSSGYIPLFMNKGCREIPSLVQALLSRSKSVFLFSRNVAPSLNEKRQAQPALTSATRCRRVNTRALGDGHSGKPLCCGRMNSDQAIKIALLCAHHNHTSITWNT